VPDALPIPARPQPSARDVTYWTLRGLVAVGLAGSAAVHLVLYGQGWSDLRGVGPLFLVNGITGIVGAVAVLVWRHWLPLVAALAFGVVTLAAYYVSIGWGLYDVHETWSGTSQVLAEITEWVAVLASVGALVRERRR
jgi:hypothetical protein